MKEKIQRKRGIKASRVKLEHALFAAGFKTQAALAEHIANIEQLESAPKDMVNRVFREKAVSAASIERIAAALNVDAYTLYLTQEASKSSNIALVDGTGDSLVAPIKNRYSLQFLLTVVVSALLLIILLWQGATFFLKNAPSRAENKVVDNGSFSKHYRSIIEEGLTPAIAFYAKPELASSLVSLRHQLENDFNIVADTIISSPETILPSEQIILKQVDYTLSLQSRQFGRHILVEAFLANEQQKVLISQHFFISKALFLKPKLLTEQLVEPIENRVKGQRSKVAPNAVFDSTAAMFYLEGIAWLDESYNLNKVKMAQGRFLNAIQINPQFADAHAGLCQAYIFESWSGDEKHLLAQATKHCQIAIEIAPNSTNAIAAETFLMRRTGRLAEAIQTLNSLPNKNATLNYELAYAQFEQFRQLGLDTKSLDIARNSTLQAIRQDEHMWKYYLLLGLIEWTDGNTERAILAYEKAAQYNQSDVVLANLGTLHYCVGNIDSAKGYYHQTLSKNPDSYLAFEQLSMLHYFAGEYPKAIELRLQAIALAGEAGIHQIWGALADMYVANNQHDEAINAYQKALAVIDRDFARGNETINDKVYQLYYSVRIAKENGMNQLSESDLLTRIEPLSSRSDSLDLSTKVRVGLLYAYISQDDKAELYLSKAIEKCPIYQQLPELNADDSQFVFKPQL
ncbi:tetratricopeptide repeat protein [Thalassotalea sp. 1_MG-2023]|uniref:tetratricopeptide repeat protein n=1 Tax=Thalassotalea sp. 1_MG-2023 TaxID=3062680 RepID=UPI0026E1BCF7|nr:tetratricopeptide repeat protein [Thalassotalea sp. 1_MG-2023]MDO6427322.1 tetratricopeptide repeat protein [Thalassotalea sp. 1_MG-2023]